ncbi:hypothetical protein CAEBREN_04671 [Caenorhabditis brenneri]|uniref:Uncharacterized protein n=1 Tax=Caenorhabditis brenneri TaxID=135651 RepID=G0NXE2_CAEBE|nr:hypothetical protein CAEBREN_04671 [Caenorhabditis brenneri]
MKTHNSLLERPSHTVYSCTSRQTLTGHTSTRCQRNYCPLKNQGPVSRNPITGSRDSDSEWEEQVVQDEDIDDVNVELIRQIAQLREEIRRGEAANFHEFLRTRHLKINGDNDDDDEDEIEGEDVEEQDGEDA